MRVTERGQVTIPKEIRDRFGFEPEAEVDFVVRGGAVSTFTAPEAGQKPCASLRAQALRRHDG